MSAKRRVERCKELLQEIGLEAERVRMFNMSSAQATAFVDATEEMTRQIRAVGPSPLRQRRHNNHNAPLPEAGE